MLPVYRIPAFTKTGLVVHGFTTRLGGSSGGNYTSLNLGLHVNDTTDNVLDNRKNLCRSMGINFDHLVVGQQVHGDEVFTVTREHLGRGNDSLEDAIPGVDALITDKPGVPLTSYYADCVPLFFFDPVNKVVGLAHAGWKGTVQKIGVKTLQKMHKQFGSKPEEILVGIGPSIGPCCYVVDNRVITKLQQAFGYWNELVVSCGEQQWMLDLWESNRRAIMNFGVKEHKISVAKLCTSCHSDIFFSHRASGGCTGRMASFIMLKTSEK
ncbi:MAG: peptidoglycan editing factor PgeF [Firmicutes bacterium]|nr:peptidoglycan editing factor PgeF [Bacillota bacterium]